VIVAEQKFSFGWVFCYDSAQHRETGALRDVIAGNAPLLVDRDTGEVLVPSTTQSVESSIRLFSEQKQRSRENEG